VVRDFSLFFERPDPYSACSINGCSVNQNTQLHHVFMSCIGTALPSLPLIPSLLRVSPKTVVSPLFFRNPHSGLTP